MLITWPGLFKGWIMLSTALIVIQRIAWFVNIYPLDSDLSDKLGPCRSVKIVCDYRILGPMCHSGSNHRDIVVISGP